MLHITGSMKTLKGELQSVKNLCKDIIGVLESVTPDTNLTKNVGIFVIQMPDYKIINKDADTAKQVLRKVCTGELSTQEASSKFASALREVNILLNMLNDFS